MKSEHTLKPCAKINSEGLKNLNIRCDTITLLEKSVGKTFYDLNHTTVFSGQSLKATEVKTKINKWD